MRVGVDFDNTVVCYDTVFHDTALKHGLIQRGSGISKTEIRDYLRNDGREDDWTSLQGLVYGAGMEFATPFAGAIDFFRETSSAYEAIIVSHRTRKPYRGDADLHAAARDWLVRHGLGDLLDSGGAYFEETREAKFARIAALGCDLFVDDLPEFLTDPAFPENVRRILFDPGNLHPDAAAYLRCTSWAEVTERVRVG